MLSVICLDPSWAPRIRARAEAYWQQSPSEERSWVCFMLLRALGNLRDPGAATFARTVLEREPNEASFGLNPPPDHWVFKAMRPFHRAAAAYAAGQVADASAAPLLLSLLDDFGSAPGVRQQAAIALGKAAPQNCLPEMRRLAAQYPEWATRRSLWEACEKVQRRSARR